jgi:hypothetical protein
MNSSAIDLRAWHRPWRESVPPDAGEVLLEQLAQLELEDLAEDLEQLAGAGGQIRPPAEASPTAYRRVWLPIRARHRGRQELVVPVDVRWTCPVCFRARGEPSSSRHYDGKHRWVAVDSWRNPCGHSDTYEGVLAEWRSEQRQPRLPLLCSV